MLIQFKNIYSKRKPDLLNKDNKFYYLNFRDLEKKEYQSIMWHFVKCMTHIKKPEFFPLKLSNM